MLVIFSHWDQLSISARLFFIKRFSTSSYYYQAPFLGNYSMYAEIRKFCARLFQEFQTQHEGLFLLRNISYLNYFADAGVSTQLKSDTDATWRSHFWLNQPFINFALYSNFAVSSPSGHGAIMVWFRLQYFVLLINLGWGLLPTSFIGLPAAFKNYTSAGSSCFKGFSRLSTTCLWVQWCNLHQLLFNLFYFNIPVYCFGQLNHKYLINAINWKTWMSFTAIWKYTHLFFYFKYTRKTSGAFKFFTYVKNQLSGLAVVVGVEYHYHTLGLLQSFNINSVGLCDATVDPWLCWYPVFCRGSDTFLQHLFLVLILRIKIFSYNMWLSGLRLYISRVLFLSSTFV